MNVLMVWPPEFVAIPRHAEQPYHFTYFGEIATYLADYVDEIKLMDCVASNLNMNDFIRESLDSYDLTCIIARPENVRQATRLAELSVEADPERKVLVYGDLANYVPYFFTQFPFFDAVVYSGDWEHSILEYIRFLEGSKTIGDLTGLLVKDDGTWSKTEKGIFLPSEEWSFSRLDLIPVEDYKRMAHDQLVLTASRGCPYNCEFCNAVVTFGKADRRKDPKEVVDYITENHEEFETVKIFSPTLTLDEEWVMSFCEEILSQGLDVSWCGTTRPDKLTNEELIRLMGLSGCYKIAIGIETLDEQNMLAISKIYDQELLRQGVSLLKRYGIIPKGLIMLGAPAQTKESVLKTFEKLNEWGVENIRPTAYSPYQELRSDMTIDEIENFDKRTLCFAGIADLSKSDLLRLVYEPELYREILGEFLATPCADTS